MASKMESTDHHQSTDLSDLIHSSKSKDEQSFNSNLQNKPLELRSSSAVALGSYPTYQGDEDSSDRLTQGSTNELKNEVEWNISGGCTNEQDVVDPSVNIKDPHMQPSSKESLTPIPSKTSSTLTEDDLHLSPNIFSKLTMFFHENSNVRILMSLLEDMLGRKLYKLDVIINDLVNFQKNSKDLAIKNERTCEMRPVTVGRAYVVAVCKTANRYPNHVTETHLDKLADLVLHQQDCFEEVVVDLCKHESKYFRTNSKTNMVLIFEACLRKMNQDESFNIDSLLSWGETPLSLAARFRCPSMVSILLKHGASIWVSWLNFKSVLEVLLFSPHIILLGDSEKNKILLCLEHVLPAMGSVRLPMKDGELAEPKGMSAFLKEWRDCIPHDQSKSPCCLKHLARLEIQAVLRRRRQLPDGIQDLPLPLVMKHYIGLESF